MAAGDPLPPGGGRKSPHEESLYSGVADGGDSSRVDRVRTGSRAWVLAGALAAAGLAATATHAGAGPEGLTADEVSFRSHDFTLHGTVWARTGATGPQPGVVLVHGSGPGPRTAYQQEAEAFAQAGIVTLAYDKRTVGYSLLHRDYALLADDALAAVEQLRSDRRVDPAKVGLWGESEGTWVVPLAASRSADVAFVILVGASGVSPARQQSWYVENELRHYGVSGSILHTLSVTDIRFAISAGLFAEPDFDVVPSLRRTSQPVLALWSVADYDHPPAEASRILRQALEAAGNRRYTMRFLAEADPGLRRSTDGWDHLDGLAPGYVGTVSAWVDDVAAGRPPGPSTDSPPRQDRQSAPLAPSGWYESATVQLVAIALCMVAFLTYPLGAAVRRLHGRRQAPAMRWPARLLVTAGLAFVLTLPAYLVVSLAAAPPGPLIGGRPLPWLVLQALALVTFACTVASAVRWTQMSAAGDRVRLGLLVTGGVVCVLLAAYWSLLVP